MAQGREQFEQGGVSLVEIMVVLVLSAILLSVTIAFSMELLGREEMRSGIYTVQAQLQLARIEAVSRSRSTRFCIDTAAGRVELWDLNDPAVTSDDIKLSEQTLSSRISFTRPDAGLPVTLSHVSGDIYEAVFSPDGSVSSGAGEIVMQGGTRWNRLSLLGAGGIRLERWDGLAWTVGS